MEHNKAISFAKTKKQQIRDQIDEFTKLQSQYATKDLEFLDEISELVIRTRRAITYTYPLRYFMENNPAKKAYFDFIQGDLEFSLEKLNKLHEKDWRDFIEPEIFEGKQEKEPKGSHQINTYGSSMHLGEKFFKYKQDVNTLRDTVERHFSKVINEIEAGLPIVCVEEVKEEDDEESDFFTKAKNWTCINCTMVNQMAFE